MQDDQPRPDLDAAIDAVVPSLTAVSDETAAASLRRTRLALAEAAPRRAGAGAWRWAVPAIAMTTALAAVLLWQPRATIDAPRERTANALPSTAPAPLQAAAPGPMPSIAVPPRPVRPQRLARATRVDATSAPPVGVPGPDPLIALTRAVEQIPEDTWRAIARAQAPLSTPELEIAPIVVEPLVTPPIADAPAAPSAEGDR
jgi:hypothetical protein